MAPDVAATVGFFNFTVPAPVLSVVTWPTTIPPIETSKVLFAVRPDTVRDSDVLPFSVFDLKVAVPVAAPAESVSCAVKVVVCLAFVEARVVLSVPTVTTELALMVVGKFAGSAC